MNKPLVSIILPTYNGSKYLEHSIESCLAQTYSNWELIIVDDCSTDQTPDIIAKYISKDQRIRSIRHEENRKLPGALNTGFFESRGRYLTWTSDDNCYRPEAISELVGYLEENSEVGLVYTDFMFIDENGVEIESYQVLDQENLAYLNCIGACFLYRREVYEKIGNYAEDLFLAEDYDYWLRVSQHFNIKPYHKDLYLYRRHELSLTSQKLKKIEEAVELTLTKNLPKLQWAEKNMRAQGYLRLYDIASKYHNYSKMFKYFIKALMVSPRFVLNQKLYGLRKLLKDILLRGSP